MITLRLSSALPVCQRRAGSWWNDLVEPDSHPARDVLDMPNKVWQPLRHYGDGRNGSMDSPGCYSLKRE
ncbi:MAG: hypothetical protein IIA61_14490 [Candidatus Marinimicrobia bacterium]|nr:hypothetical protein [Candidatus Neomarinimicrobiota bacterium]